MGGDPPRIIAAAQPNGVSKNDAQTSEWGLHQPVANENAMKMLSRCVSKVTILIAAMLPRLDRVVFGGHLAIAPVSSAMPAATAMGGLIQSHSQMASSGFSAGWSCERPMPAATTQPIGPSPRPIWLPCLTSSWASSPNASSRRPTDDPCGSSRTPSRPGSCSRSPLAASRRAHQAGFSFSFMALHISRQNCSQSRHLWAQSFMSSVLPFSHSSAQQRQASAHAS